MMTHNRHPFPGHGTSSTLWAFALWMFASPLLVLGNDDSTSPQLMTGPPSFRNDVMAVLSKGGCNMGACHGNQNGKGGLRLSLRGEDPHYDYGVLVRQYEGRRVSRLEPAESLLLQKPTMQLAHEGGRRFSPDSLEYDILLRWIAEGAHGPVDDEPRLEHLEVDPPEVFQVGMDEPVSMRVMARFSDGTERDVTELAVYEPSTNNVEVASNGQIQATSLGETTLVVRFLDRQIPVHLAFVPPAPEEPMEAEAANFVDVHLHRKQERLHLRPSELSGDSTFVRRLYLDLLGILPTAEEAREFVADPDPDKRSRLIDQLLVRPEFAEHWALKWSDLLRNEEKVLDGYGVTIFYRWIRDSIQDNLPLDRFAQEILTARGSTYDVGASNFYRANRDATTRGEAAARVFLGLRLQCAQCHNHPFDRWTQDDYYSWTSWFSGIDYEIITNERRDRLDNNEFVGEQIVTIANEGTVKNPRTDQPAPPRFLGDSTDLDSEQDRLEQLAAWVTSAENPYFSRVMANWIWYHMMGRGLVEPIDDFRLTNPPTNPELLEALAGELVARNFDLRNLVRVIANSAAYQRSAIPNETNQEDEGNFSRAIVRRLAAEKLVDAQSQVLDAPIEFAGYPLGTRAGQLHGVRRERRASEGDRFLMTFGKPERLLACDCERSYETTLSQAFFLIGGSGLHDRLGAGENRLARWAAGDMSNEALIDELYWTTLQRPPESAEQEGALQLFAEEPDRFLALQDLAWALMNSKEFIFRH
jgi:hypothetical protein